MPLIRAVLAFSLALLLLAPPSRAQDDGPDPELLTVAESSGFEQTATYDEVRALAEKLSERSERVHLDVLGTTVEGREIPLLIIADPPVEKADDVGKRMVCLLIGNIHAGEVCGKEALMMLARELSAGEEPSPLLKDLVVAIVPIYNADGNERMDAGNRPGQVGPQRMGVRPNAQGLDLNRDHMKIEAPETRALLRFMNEWDPAVTIDTHTTNGSHHRYVLTYACNKHPAGDPALTALVRERMLPEVTRRLDEEFGHSTFFYGNFNQSHTEWRDYPAFPRFGTPYRGLRNRIAILSEAYSYATYQQRVMATLDFCRECLAWTSEHEQEIASAIKAADQRTAGAGRNPRSDDLVPVRVTAHPFSGSVTIKGYVETTDENGVRVPTDQQRDYSASFVADWRGSVSVPRVYAYLFPSGYEEVAETLQRHGIEVDYLREDRRLDVEVSKVNRLDRAARPWQGHQMVTLGVKRRGEARTVPAGTYVVRTDQPLGTLVAMLLEPESDDGLATWNFFDEQLSTGADFPVLRLPKRVPMLTGSVRPLAEDREFDQPITLDLLYGEGDRPNFNGSVMGSVTWLDEDHYLQARDRRLYRVHAPSGRSTPYLDIDAIARTIGAMPAIEAKDARRIAGTTRPNMDEGRTRMLFSHADDLYVAMLDGSGCVRLTSTPEDEELAEFSPDGKWVSFVRDNDLYVVDVATQNERRLTTGGTDSVRNAKATWVYFEEVFGRSWRAYWWSPDSRRIVFFHTDDSSVKRFTIVDDLENRQTVEVVPYPKPGEHNPTVRVGVVEVAGGSPEWLDLRDYDEPSTLVTRVDFWPDGDLMVCVQDRAQTWLDVLRFPSGKSEGERLFRETTEAWVSRPEFVEFLDDGSFLFPSERSGYMHLYHYDKKGELKKQVTEGEWDVRSFELLVGDRVFFEGTRDSWTSNHLYVTTLEGGEPERLTEEAGSHRASVGPGGAYFIDWFSSIETPSKAALKDGTGRFVRWLDINEVFDLETYRASAYERFTIPTEDGFELEAVLLRPPGFDPESRYPVWFQTYGGPQAATVSDAWSYRWAWDQMLAQMGFVVFRADPRSASNKGARSAWTMYRQAGVQELADIATAIEWLKQKPWVDGERIGMSGHSYGGFMTAYAMTHSELFRAGIAGAPVTDWRDYDTIYTERYMATPGDNPEGYAETSVVDAADDLHGTLLVLHGTMDDNVHMQNSVRLIKALQDADKSLEVMIYPGSRHGIRGGLSYRRLMTDFMKRHLGGPEPPAESERDQTPDREIEVPASVS